MDDHLTLNLIHFRVESWGRVTDESDDMTNVYHVGQLQPLSNTKVIVRCDLSMSFTVLQQLVREVRLA